MRLSISCLEYFQTFDRLNKNALLERGLAQVLLHGASQWPLNADGDDQDQWQHEKGDPPERPANDEDDTKEHEHKGQVGNGCQGCRGSKVAYRFKLAQLVCKAA
ncbi:hypothetical protein D3C71_1715110 [compost metagenome]